MNAIAEPLTFEGDYVAALALFQRLEHTENPIGHEGGTAYALINQGDMLWRLGRYSDSDARGGGVTEFIKLCGPRLWVHVRWI